jgi:hypothetical protein
MYPHRIRLRGPWECEPLRRDNGGDEPLPQPFRMTMPCRWNEAGLLGFRGRVRFRRAFGYPGRIDAHERVWLTFAGIDGAAEAQLNNHPLGPIATASEIEVTSLLRPRNELVVEVEGTTEQGGLWDEVALEVRCTAFLRDLRSYAILTDDRVELRVSGQVAGMADRPLEVYLLLDRSVVGYQVVTAAAEGQPFEIVVPEVPLAKWASSEGRVPSLPVQVDLVNGAVVWYTSRGEVKVETLSDRSR